ncbi:MAG: DUF6702 family protein [Gilvibacter sp.]
MRILKVAVVLSLLISFGFAPAVHKFYVSITKVEYVKEQGAVQIISKIFIDDLEDVFKERYDKNISLDETSDNTNLDSYLSKYLDQKLKVTINGEPQQLRFIGKEYDIETLVCYIEVVNVPDIKTLEISNKVLFELFPEQQNIIHFKTPEGRRSMILEKDNPSYMLKFN